MRSDTLQMELGVYGVNGGFCNAACVGVLGVVGIAAICLGYHESILRCSGCPLTKFVNRNSRGLMSIARGVQLATNTKLENIFVQAGVSWVFADGRYGGAKTS